MNEHELDDLLARARSDMPSSAFLARVMQDAISAQPAPREPFWAGVLSLIGGWGAMGGLAAATVAGVWLGAVGGADMAGYVGFTAGEIGAVELMSEGEIFALAGEIGG